MKRNVFVLFGAVAMLLTATVALMVSRATLFALLNVYRVQIVTLASRYRVPTVYPWRFFSDLGGLMSYGFDQRDSFHTAAVYVDRILKGEKPGDLPVQAPTKYELVINRKSARPECAAVADRARRRRHPINTCRPLAQSGHRRALN
jgi:ABC-type uncharacterized transport system substrate-binding protein